MSEANNASFDGFGEDYDEEETGSKVVKQLNEDVKIQKN